jgi:HhH-GPD superfamily base excision DNA repair protein/SnoaL-like domain
MEDLPQLDAFGTLIFQVVGQQLSVAATRTIVSRIEEHFGGRLPTPAEALAADPQVLRSAGLSARKGATLRALAERFADERLSDEGLAAMADDEVEAALTEVPGIGPWSARGLLLVALDRPDVFLTGDIALRRAIQRVYGFDHVPTEDGLTSFRTAGGPIGASLGATSSRPSTTDDPTLTRFDRWQSTPSSARRRPPTGSPCASYATTTHFNGQSTVTLDGDSTTRESYTIAHHVDTEDGNLKIMIASLRYLDTFAKIDGRWYFAERKLILDWSETRSMTTPATA